MKPKHLTWISVALMALMSASCKKDDNGDMSGGSATITVENVLDSRPLVESGTFMNTGSSSLIMPGQSVSIQFSAAKGQALSFATMYGWSNDLFFAPASPGIALYKSDGTPIEGDVSSEIRLWDNGTRINGKPGKALMHPGTAETAPSVIKEIKGMDDQGNSYAAASDLMEAKLHYDGNSTFTLMITNTSGSTSNPTPFSPGVWAISYIAGGKLLNPDPLYKEGQLSLNGLTDIAEMGNPEQLSAYINGQTGIFTPLSPVLVVVYNGIENPVFMPGAKDPGNGLTDIAQKGDATALAGYLKKLPGVKSVYVLAASGTTVLLPKVGEDMGGSVSQKLTLDKNDKIAVATMYGFSNDWFFASKTGIDGSTRGDVSADLGLYDDGTAISQYPGAGITQFNLAGTPLGEDKEISEVPNPNMFTTLPDVKDMIRVTIN